MAETRVIGDNSDVAFEASDISLRVVGFAALGIFLWLGLIPLILSYGYPEAVKDAAKAPAVLAAEPRQQVDPHADLLTYLNQQHLQLTTYGWIDRDHGIARIPIDDAMKRLAATGVPGWPASSAPASGGSTP